MLHQRYQSKLGKWETHLKMKFNADKYETIHIGVKLIGNCIQGSKLTATRQEKRLKCYCRQFNERRAQCRVMLKKLTRY